MVCLDSSFIIDNFRGETRAVEMRKSLEKRGEVLFIPTPVIMELALGAHLSKRMEDEKEKINRFLSDSTILEFDKESAFLGGKIEAELMKKGSLIEPEDIMIAAIAMINNEPLVTRNTKHFARIEGLKIEGYETAK